MRKARIMQSKLVGTPTLLWKICLRAIVIDSPLFVWDTKSGFQTTSIECCKLCGNSITLPSYRPFILCVHKINPQICIVWKLWKKSWTQMISWNIPTHSMNCNWYHNRPILKISQKSPLVRFVIMLTNKMINTCDQYKKIKLKSWIQMVICNTPILSSIFPYIISDQSCKGQLISVIHFSEMLLIDSWMNIPVMLNMLMYKQKIVG